MLYGLSFFDNSLVSSTAIINAASFLVTVIICLGVINLFGEEDYVFHNKMTNQKGYQRSDKNLSEFYNSNISSVINQTLDPMSSEDGYLGDEIIESNLMTADFSLTTRNSNNSDESSIQLNAKINLNNENQERSENSNLKSIKIRIKTANLSIRITYNTK